MSGQGSSWIHSQPAGGNFSCLLIIFANSLDPDQARHLVGSDLDLNCLPLLCYSKQIKIL